MSRFGALRAGEGAVPGWMEPMLATLVPSLPDSRGWLFERKLDGIRALALRDGAEVRAHAGQHFVRPRLVAQVGFTEWTRDGKLRHPRFLGLRLDKAPREVVRERASG